MLNCQQNSFTLSVFLFSDRQLKRCNKETVFPLTLIDPICKIAEEWHCINRYSKLSVSPVTPANSYEGRLYI